MVRMEAKKCPKCGSDELEETMEHKYSMWGEFMGAEAVLKCKKCGELVEPSEKEP